MRDNDHGSPSHYGLPTANCLDTSRDSSRDLHIGLGTRLYLPTLSDLIDRLTIVQLKQIFLHEKRDEYVAERKLIEHDIDVVLNEMMARDNFRFGAREIRAAVVIMLTNRTIWENESKARLGGSEQDKLLKLTHSINGLRNTAKNIISASCGERRDFKIDCFAADLVKEFGQWNIFDE